MSGPRGIEVLVRPGASRDEIAGEHDGAIVVRLTAPPVEGRANKLLCKLLAKQLGVPRSHVSIVVGERARRKTIRVRGLGAEAARRLLLDQG